MTKIFNIYSLTDPLDNQVGYVGATSLLLNVRYSQHKHNALTKKLKTKVSVWFREVVDKGVLPEIKHLEICKEEEWQEKEIYWISKFNNLNNTKKGGTGVVLDRSVESKQRSINAHKIPVVLLDKEFNLIKDFNSCSECADYLKLGVTAIANALSKNGSRCLKNGLVVCTKHDYVSGNYSKIYKGIYKTTYQFDLNGNFIKQFNTVNEAFQEVKPSKYHSGIFQAARDNLKCGNYLWSFKKDTDFTKYLNSHKKVIKN